MLQDKYYKGVMYMDKFILTEEETVFMVVDIQERLVPAMPEGQKVIRNTNILLNLCKKLDIPIIVTEQYPKGLGKTVSEVSDNLGELTVYEKISYTGYTDDVKSALKQLGKKKVIIAGIETHVCVLQTTRDLLANGYQVFVLGDAVSSRTKENYQNGLSLMSAMGAVVTNTETVVFDILKQAGTPLFKEMSKLIK
jgi:nicotinamidase-related amidase